ncbi:hypothetical protein AVEN_7741-1, partial [Araneus ventricosus]
GQEIADLREAVKELTNIVSNLTPTVNDIAKLQEVNRQCVGRIAEIQINLDRQVAENNNLKKYIETQRATIESLQSKIAVLESNFDYNPIPSPIVGDDQRTLADLNQFRGNQAPSLLDLSICSAEIVNKISLEVSHDLYDSDHCPILLSLLDFGMKAKVTRKYINWAQFSERINDNLRGTDNLSSIEDLSQFFKVSAGSSSYSFTRSTHQHSPWWDVKCNYLKALKRKLLRKAKSYPSRANWIAYKNKAGALRKYAKERKDKFWDHTCQEAASSHQTFRIIKALLDKDGSPCVSNLMLSSGSSLTAPVAQANAIAMSLIKKPPEERIPFDFSPSQNLRSDFDSLNCSFSMRERI